MCNLCQQELRDHAAHAASRSEQASPRNGLASQGRKSGMQSAFAAEVRTLPHKAAMQSKFVLIWRTQLSSALRLWAILQALDCNHCCTVPCLP